MRSLKEWEFNRVHVEERGQHEQFLNRLLSFFVAKGRHEHTSPAVANFEKLNLNEKQEVYNATSSLKTTELVMLLDTPPCVMSSMTLPLAPPSM
ncbi:hypothetical protein X975_10346, partial [Stegodyphus mimosarum]